MIRYSEPIYQKVGRRYKQVGEYMQFDCFPLGAHLLVVQKGSTSYLHNVEPDKAGVLAAMKIAKDAMLHAFMEASDLRPANQPVTITQEQQDLLDKLKETGFNSEMWIRESSQGIIDAGMKVLEKYDESKTTD